MTTEAPPDWVQADPWLELAEHADDHDVDRALGQNHHTEDDFAALISPSASTRLEELALRAKSLTQQNFGNTISLFAPLYLSDYCSAGCIYCGFSSDLDKPRRRLDLAEARRELEAMKNKGFDEILLLTGDRTKFADADYLIEHTAQAAEVVSHVSVETFSMTTPEYESLAAAGCTSIALYQETYNPEVFKTTHRWGPKSNYNYRIEAPARALEAGIRSISLGVLLGLANPFSDALSTFRHARALQSRYWRSGIAISFPRIRPQLGGFSADTPVSDRQLAQIIFAFRICLPEASLTLSTREPAAYRDGLAGVGINKMSISSKTTVGGYAEPTDATGQFEISDERDIPTFCAALRERNLEPVFKSWDAVYR